jgi:SAM-dependent methyltransferase
MTAMPFLLDYPSLYGWFHAVFSKPKGEALCRHLCQKECKSPVRVLDLGCGPGTNAGIFLDASRYSYLGIDMNRRYIREASKKYRLKFRCADITQLPKSDALFDVILINSVLHHLNDKESRKLLSSAKDFLEPEGECLVLDMVSPVRAASRNFVQRMMIQLDRGAYCRSPSKLHRELSEHFDIQSVHIFDIQFIGILLWDLRLIACGRKKKGSGQ